MITELKKLMKKLILSVLIMFSVFTGFSDINAAYAASYVTNEDFRKVVKCEVFLKTLSKRKGKFYVSCVLYRYIKDTERIRCAFKEYWSINGNFKVFIFGGDHYVNIARNIAWDMFKRKASYFIINEKQSMMDSADNVESLIFSIKNKILPVYNNCLLKIGADLIDNLDSDEMAYICTEACRMYHCYALDFETYVDFCYLYEI